MKTHLSRLAGKIGACLTFALCSVATFPLQTALAEEEQSVDQTANTKLSQNDLKDLLGPIALYPDALVALILPASTVPADITMAVRYLNDNGDSVGVENQSWDESVKALARYPDVLKWMDQNLEWTNSLGEAFVEQPADVMNAVQSLRAEAKAKGNLVDTPEQTVVVSQDTQEIRIVPTEPDVIYVPQYDPEVVYVREYEPSYGPVLAFSAGFAAGAWLTYDVDWRNRSVYYGRESGWNNRARWNDRGSREGNINVVNTTVNNTTINNSSVNRWQASANTRHQIAQRQRQNLGNARLVKSKPGQSRPATQPTTATSQQPAAGRVPKPARLNTSRAGTGGKHPGAAVHTSEVNSGNAPVQAPDASIQHPNAAHKSGVSNHHPKPENPAPAVSGQSGENVSPKKHPNQQPSVRNPEAGPYENPGKHGPSEAPPMQIDPSESPRKQHQNPNRSPQPVAPQNAPQVQEPAKHHQRPVSSPDGQPQIHQSPGGNKKKKDKSDN